MQVQAQLACLHDIDCGKIYMSWYNQHNILFCFHMLGIFPRSSTVRKVSNHIHCIVFLISLELL